MTGLIQSQLQRLQRSLDAVLRYAERHDYRGYGKHDALNSRFLKALSLNRKWLRLLIIQAIMRSPINLRPLFRVRTYRNPKGIALFARSYLNLYESFGRGSDSERARKLLDWLLENQSIGTNNAAWGYFWDWQDLGFYAPFGSPNCVVTCFVGQAFLDGFQVFGDDQYVATARSAIEFIRTSLPVLYEDEVQKCYSYVPDPANSMVVMDVSALAGALMARTAAHTGETELFREARKLVNYVVDKQTDYGAWYYTHPPEDSPVKHDNYHTGFILDALLDYSLASGDDSFLNAYKKGLEFYARELFLPSGAPKWRSDKNYPFDVHGAGTAIGVFERAADHIDSKFLQLALRTAEWAISEMQAKEGYFYYQKTVLMTKRFTLMRWCNAWMAYGLSRLLMG